jgi:hypothetical protein
VSDRGVVRARVVFGGLILFAAVISWFTGLMMSPHGAEAGSNADHVRAIVVQFIRRNAIGNLVLCAIAAWLLAPLQRAPRPARDLVLIAIIGVIVVTSFYQLFWLRSVSG